MIFFNRLPDSSDGKRPKGVQKNHRLTVPTRVEFLSPPLAQRVPPQQPEQLLSHQKIDTHGSNDHACHRGCNSRFDESNQVVDDRPAGLATIAALRIAESTPRFLVPSFATAGTR